MAETAQQKILRALLKYGAAKMYTGHKTTLVTHDKECVIFGSQNNVIGLLANKYATNGRKQRRYFPTYGQCDTWKISEKGIAALPKYLRPKPETQGTNTRGLASGTADQDAVKE